MKVERYNLIKLTGLNSTTKLSIEMAEKKVTAEEVREAGLDKFYTIPSISEKCIKTVGTKYGWLRWDLVIEPSAGNGSFLTKIPTIKKIGIDIAPGHADIIAKDFFDYKPPPGLTNILVIGNPPFGRVSSLAVKFFNYSAEWCSVIAFIIPKTFRRVSLQNRLNRKFHLIHDDEIPSDPCSFSPPMQVKCCFQIWEKKSEDRDLIQLSTMHADWDFLSHGPLDNRGQPTPPSGADFVVLAYGGKCGSVVKTDLNRLRPKSWHWIKAKIDIDVLIERFNSLDYSLSKDTARQNSIGRGELVKLYSESFD
jgi:predicted RNA methylase